MSPILSFEGSLEVLHEIKYGSPDTPARRRMFAMASAMGARRKQLELEEQRRAPRFSMSPFRRFYLRDGRRSR